MTRDEALALGDGALVTWLDDRTKGRHIGRLVKVGYKHAVIEIGGKWAPPKTHKERISDISPYKKAVPKNAE
jgi:hypothetical protein